MNRKRRMNRKRSRTLFGPPYGRKVFRSIVKELNFAGKLNYEVPPSLLPRKSQILAELMNNELSQLGMGEEEIDERELICTETLEGMN